MKKPQIKQQLKLTALNAIRKIYHPKFKGYDRYDTESNYQEQRDHLVREIILNLEKELKQLKEITKK